MFKPIKEEVLDGFVEEVSTLGDSMTVSAGPLKVIITKTQMNEDFEFDSVNKMWN